jgi:hypothetical protein
MRKVLKSTSEVAHFWANQVQSEGRASSIFYDENKIYSFGKHYTLAVIEKSETRDRNVFFLNTNKYSNTTAKHQNIVSQAVPKLDNVVIYCPFPGNQFYKTEYRLQQIVEHLCEQARDAIKKQLKARENSYHITQAAQYLNEAYKICDNFNGVSKASIEAIYNSAEYSQANTKAIRIDATRIEREKKAEQNRAKKEREHLAKWLKHEHNGTLYSIPVSLRLSKDMTRIQTTRGAEVPTEQALEIWTRIVAGENVLGEKLGHYTIDEITPEHIQVGCHLIEVDTVKSFVKSLRVLRAANKINAKEGVNV